MLFEVAPAYIQPQYKRVRGLAVPCQLFKALKDNQYSISASSLLIFITSGYFYFIDCF